MTDRKNRIVNQLEDGFRGSPFIVVAYDRVTAEAFADIRRKLKPGAPLRVVKGTLARIAAARAGVPGEVAALIRGPVAIAFVNGDVAATARLLAGESARGLAARGGLDGRPLSAADVGELARIGSRQSAEGRAARSMRAPAARLAAALRALERSRA